MSITTILSRKVKLPTAQRLNRIYQKPLHSMSNEVTADRSVATSQQIKVDIISDGICPFCFFGIRNLKKALATAKLNTSSPLARLKFDLEFKPFVLDPTLTREPIDRRKKYEARHGKEGLVAREKMMQERAKECGVTLLLHAAYAKGGSDMQVPLAERLFSGYFEHQKNPGSREYLACEAVTSGVFPTIEAANDFFESDQYDAEVKQGYLRARMMGVTGIPFFVFDGKVAVSGAQPPEVFLKVFRDLASPNNGSGGDTLNQDATPDGSGGGTAKPMTRG
ncbi:hypothetical protein QFC24_004283 [Naganishia onofrii]|uniref:Uncharacterized protein n=1 Tax=Naganishia onofrii TaxID=1851511 RepID=A0ACC2XF86_9TREE|nr:hypothetical protein QFC24_004283 [Naganishia onofrii]